MAEETERTKRAVGGVKGVSGRTRAGFGIREVGSSPSSAVHKLSDPV